MPTSLVFQFEDSLTLEKFLNLAKQLKVSYRNVSNNNDAEETLWDSDIHPIIQERLTEKYVKTGEWKDMDDEERQDASLLEKMLYDEEQPDNKVYSISESEQILADLKKQLYAHSTP